MAMQTRRQRIRQWWEHRRLRYNLGLLFSGALAFLLWDIVGPKVIGPEFDITLFALFFQGIAFGAMMGLANIFYFLGPFVDRRRNLSDDDHFRLRLFNIGFWFSISLPLILPIWLLVKYIKN